MFRLNKYIKLLIVIVFVLLVAVQAGKSFVLDEIDFPVVSHATSLTAKPIYYRGEKSPVHVGTYHPTLYINSLASFIKIFGFSETSVRFFGIICTLISAYLLILILRQLIKKNETAEMLLLGLFLLNPYTIANTTLPDIDSTVLPVVILLFIYFALHYLLQLKDMGNRVVLILAGLFGLALWSKLTTPLIIPVFLLCLAVITSKNYKKSLFFTLKVSVAGFLAFLVTYFLYCKILGLSTTYTYGFLWDSFAKGTSSEGPLKGAITNIGNLKHFVYWPTMPIVVLYGTSFLGVMFDKKKDKKTQIRKLLVLLGLLVTIFYIALIAPFGGFFKYPFPVYGISILTIIFFYDRYFRKIDINLLYALLATSVGFLLEKIFWKDSMFLNGAPFKYLAILLLVIIVCYITLKINTRNVAANLFVLLIFFSIGFQLSISRIQAISPYPTKYHYGQEGLDQVAAYLRSNTTSNEAIWAMKDVGYYVNNKYYESYEYYFNNELENHLVNLLDGGEVRYYVVTTKIGQDNIDYYPRIKQILEANAVREKQFGNFIIYKSKE